MNNNSMTVSLLLFVGSIGVSRAFVARSQAGSCSSSSSRRSAGMASLPGDVVKYSQVPKAPKKFTASTIPKGLLNQHTTKKGTWGVIRVSKGKLEYQINEPSIEKFVIDPSTVGIIEPTVLHQVKSLTDDLEFVVEFHRLPGTGPVDEKRE